MVYALYRHYKLSIGESIVLLLVINVILDWGLMFAPHLRRYIVAVVAIVGILNEVIYIKNIRPKIELKWIKISITLLAVAALIWILDITKILCYPHSIIQGHAIWHILISISIYSLYIYYKSEHRANNS